MWSGTVWLLTLDTAGRRGLARDGPRGRHRGRRRRPAAASGAGSRRQRRRRTGRPRPRPATSPHGTRKSAYKSKITEAQHEIAEGNTYEVCLTTALTADLPAAQALDPRQAYLALRRRNPAPFASYLRFGGPHRGEHLAGAVPADRGRRRDARRADQGHPAPGRGPGAGRAAAAGTGVLARRTAPRTS